MPIHYINSTTSESVTAYACICNLSWMPWH